MSIDAEISQIMNQENNTVKTGEGLDNDINNILNTEKKENTDPVIKQEEVSG